MRRTRNQTERWQAISKLAVAMSLVLGLAGPASAGEAASTSTIEPHAVEKSEVPRLAKRRGKKKRRSSKSKSKPAPAPRAAPAPAPASSVAPADRRSGPSRIEFDDRLIQGQTNKANAIYLFERRASELRTLVKKRKHFHREIDESLD